MEIGVESRPPALRTSPKGRDWRTVVERPHERLSSGKIHRSLGMGHSGNGESEEKGCERAKQADYSSLEGAFV